MKKISVLLTVVMLCTMFQFTGNLAYADVPFSDVVVSSALSGAIDLIEGPDGKLYVSDYFSNKIVRMDKDGSNVTPIPAYVANPIGLVSDSDGNLFVTEYQDNNIVKIDEGGSKSTIKEVPGKMMALALDSHDTLFMSDYAQGKIYKMDTDGSNFAVFATVLNGTAPVLSSLGGLGIDANDNLYVADKWNHRIIKIDTNGVQSDFASVMFPQWVSVGRDGYVYASAGNRTIQKFDMSGNKIETYSTGNSNAWGTYVDADGSIYYTTLSPKINRILGQADTVDRTHIKISLIYDLISGEADPAAFTLSGIASSPRVISAVVNGSEIDLTLDANIEATDANLKVSYTKTGTSNLTRNISNSEIGAFSNLVVTNHVVGVYSVEQFSDINVDNGTALSAITLPATAVVKLKNAVNSTTNSAVVWDSGTPAYNGNKAGTYAFKGTITLGTGIYNPENIQATVNVVVAEPVLPVVTSSSAMDDIIVSNGTKINAIELPQSVTVNLNNSTTTSAAIKVWDSGTPSYDGNKEGSYVFEGLLATSTDYLNTNNIRASVTVKVKSKPAELPAISSVKTLDVITVENGTEINAIKLPQSVMVNLNNSTTTSAAIAVWDRGTPSYNGSKEGSYIFRGILAASTDYLNINNIKATVTVKVKSKPVELPVISSVKTLDAITVANGTGLSKVGLPATVSIGLSDSTTSSAVVTWDSGTPVYNGNTAGTYVFSGTLGASNEYTNDNQLMASIQVVVKSAQSTGGGGGGDRSSTGSSQAAVPSKTSGSVSVNGVDQNVSSEAKSIENGKTKVTVSVDDEALKKVIENTISNAATGIKNIVKINVQDTSADTTLVALNGDIVKQMERGSFDILIDSGDKNYKIPAQQLSVDSIAKKFNVDSANLASIEFDIQFDKVSLEAETEIFNKAVVVQPTAFKITATVKKTDGTTASIEVDTFSQFVKREFKIPSNISLSDITTGVVFDQNGKYNQVPTRIYTEDGQVYAQINSLTNSIYAVIKNSIKVSSVEGHWSESIVNDMASRLILTEYDAFDADKNITRGELADYMVKALGIYRQDTVISTPFTDVKSTDKNARAIAIASHWNLISGYEDGTFKANDEITREEAMVIFSKAMDLAEYKGISGDSNFDINSYETVPNWSKPYIQKVLDGKVFVGKSDYNLGLKDNLTHAEALAAIKNLMVKAQLMNQ